MNVIRALNNSFVSPLLPIVLLIAGIYCHIRYKGFILFKPFHIVKTLLQKEKGQGKNGSSPFKAVMLALAGTLGVGNITGVATALKAGGTGALFWMWVSALVSMALKYSETVLAVKYRITENGKYKGGAVYYISKALHSRFLAIIFALLCIFCSYTLGNMIQIKATASCFTYCFNINPLYVGIFAAVLCFFVIYKGVKSISDFSAATIPFLSLLYCAFSLFIIFSNIDKMPSVLYDIICNAFSFSSLGGGVIGFFTSRALRYGVSRGLASNESGCGTAPYAHASADASSAVKQGFWGIFEVYADTILICSMTGFVILLSPYYGYMGFDGMLLAIKSYEYFLGKASSYFMCFSVFFYSLSSAVCWSYYGSESVAFINKNKIYKKMYILSYCLILILGSVTDSETLWELSDFSIGLMAIINTLCLCLLSKEVGTETELYFSEVSSRKKEPHSPSK